MASLLQLKADIEDQKGTSVKMVFSGATEAHLLADEIGMLLILNCHFLCLTNAL